MGGRGAVQFHLRPTGGPISSRPLPAKPQVPWNRLAKRMRQQLRLLCRLADDGDWQPGKQDRAEPLRDADVEGTTARPGHRAGSKIHWAKPIQVLGAKPNTRGRTDCRCRQHRKYDAQRWVPSLMSTLIGIVRGGLQRDVRTTPTLGAASLTRSLRRGCSTHFDANDGKGGSTCEGA